MDADKGLTELNREGYRLRKWSSREMPKTVFVLVLILGIALVNAEKKCVPSARVLPASRPSQLCLSGTRKLDTEAIRTEAYQQHPLNCKSTRE
ncbi:hypothetical protein GCK32_017120 [Trichostrongylus colubriformis]|uniref:Uncharacterized protein n=1 Tax=Trichostrongylus colubriformis TaxID=6319 RepID=A0AAN8F5U8_TRICO